jgi:hypothetical protein
MFAWSIRAGAWFWMSHFSLSSSSVVFCSKDFNVFYVFEDRAMRAVSERSRTRSSPTIRRGKIRKESSHLFGLMSCHLETHDDPKTLSLVGLICQRPFTEGSQKERCHHFEHTDLAVHPAVMMTPCQVSIMSIFEDCCMNVPSLVPSPRLLAKWQTECRLLNELTWDMLRSRPKNHSNAQGWTSNETGSPVWPFDPNDQSR